MSSTYRRAVLVGILFFVVTNAMAINAVFGHLTGDQLAALTPGLFTLACIKVLALAGTNLLAYFNQSVARADIQAGPNPPKTST